MTREKLLRCLKAILNRDLGNLEPGHRAADILLLKYLADEEITTAYDAIEKWYS